MKLAEMELDRITEEQRMSQDNCIFLCRTGSQMYGTNTINSDSDFTGIYIPNREYICGLKGCEMVEYRTNKVSSNKRNSAGDVDVNLYGLHKWVQLAIHNNPNILELMFAAPNVIMHKTKYWDMITNNKHLFLSKKIYHSFRGYAHSQRMRTITKSGNNTGRVDLIKEHGFDCYHKDTEFLTECGWKLYDDIKNGEKVGTLNKDTNTIEFQLPTDRIKKHYEGDLYLYKTFYSSFKITPNHNVFVSSCHRSPYNKFNTDYNKESIEKIIWKLIPIQEVNKERKSWYYIRQGVNNTNIDNCQYNDDILNVIGLYVSEGSMNFRNNKIKNLRIVQTNMGKKEVFNIMDDLSERLSFKKYIYDKKRKNNLFETIWVTHNKNIINNIYNDCGHGSHIKRLPKWIYDLSPRQCKVLLKALILGDGTFRKSSKQKIDVYYTCNYNLAGDVQMLAILAGYNANVMGPYKYPPHPSSCIQTSTEMLQVVINYGGNSVQALPMNTKYKKVEKSHQNSIKNYNKRGVHLGGCIEPYNGDVVCFEVPNSVLITRYDGKIAMQGNCKLMSHNIRLYLECIQLLNEGQITLPLPERKMVVQIKRGEWKLEDILKKSDELSDSCTRLYETTKLPYSPDFEGINKLLMDIQDEYWGVTYKNNRKKIFGIW